MKTDRFELARKRYGWTVKDRRDGLEIIHRGKVLSYKEAINLAAARNAAP